MGNKIRCDFSFDHYREILNLFKKRGYKFSFFSESPNLKMKRVYLRHDVDFSLEKALKMAQIENENNVHSTYFIRLSAPFYNIFSPDCSKIIKEIFSLGHQVGLHFEGGFYETRNTTKKTIEKEVSRQLSILKDYFKAKSVVSFHRPSKFIFNHKFGDFINTYENKFFGKIKYLSDSKGNWREGCVCRWLNSSTPPHNLQILIHPIWWGRKEKDLNLFLQNFLKEKFKYLDAFLQKDCQSYKKKIF